MAGDGQRPSWKDITYKVFWTGVAAALGLAVVLLSDANVTSDVWWALPAIGLINSALAWVRQEMGVTPPDASDTTLSSPRTQLR